MNATFSVARSPWLANVQPRTRASLRLFCFPYAGGNTTTYHNWSADLPPGVEVYPVQLPGRALRLREALITRMDDLVLRMAEALLPFFDCKFAFFGHSMGALMAFELARLLRREHQLEPKCLLVSGRKAPQLPDPVAATYTLPDDSFLQQVGKLNGTPAELLTNKEMLQMLLPILRADFELVQTYRYQEGVNLSCPIKVYGGLMDEHVSRNSLLQWRDHSTAPFSITMLPGNHFFIQNLRKQFLAQLSRDLEILLENLKLMNKSL